MDNIKFGVFVADLRKEKDMTQSDLAKILHVTDKAVSRWECGLGFPDIKLWEPLAAALDVSLLELLRARRSTEDTLTNEEAGEAVSAFIAKASTRPRWGGLALSGLSAALSITGGFYLVKHFFLTPLLPESLVYIMELAPTDVQILISDLEKAQSTVFITYRDDITTKLRVAVDSSFLADRFQPQFIFCALLAVGVTLLAVLAIWLFKKNWRRTTIE